MTDHSQPKFHHHPHHQTPDRVYKRNPQIHPHQDHHSGGREHRQNRQQERHSPITSPACEAFHGWSHFSSEASAASPSQAYLNPQQEEQTYRFQPSPPDLGLEDSHTACISSTSLEPLEVEIKVLQSTRVSLSLVSHRAFCSIVFIVERALLGPVELVASCGREFRGGQLTLVSTSRGELFP
jgi:hypothetical protein